MERTKKMPLVKPMVGCTPNGYITHVLGPFDANHNDAVILKDCFHRFQDEMSTLQEGDVILADRGFRDVITYLKEDKKFNVYCPGIGQLETIEANQSRFVTKVRWVIEQVFGRLKTKFRIFALPAHNATLADDNDSLKIAFALLNLFHKPICSDQMYENVATIMTSRLNVPNKLKSIVEQYNLAQVKVPYIEVNYTRLDNRENNNLLQFPELTMNDLYYLSLGSYQIKNAVSYYAEHNKDNIFLVHKFQPNARHATATLNFINHGIDVAEPLKAYMKLVKAYMKSRYRSGKHHHIFVLVDTNKCERDAIVEYYCTCESGARTVGCCSHIMTIVWYLSYGQYHGITVPNPEICNVSITIPKNK